MRQGSDTARPDTAGILAGLKNFQRDTVEHVFRRLYLDEDSVRRFLVADEVGLGKTLVARGVIAKAIDHLRDKTKRIDIVYICSNTDIARQNIDRLNVTGHDDFSLSSRITLLPLELGEMQQRNINFVSFTPGTSFNPGQNTGKSRERELLYWLLKKPWRLNFDRATRVLRGNAGLAGFRYRVQQLRDRFVGRSSRQSCHSEIRRDFEAQILERIDLRDRFRYLMRQLRHDDAERPIEVRQEANVLIGELRKLLARTCLRWLQPDLIILDEFQRFKDLMQCDSDNASEAAELAQHLFNFQHDGDDTDLAARVLLLSATPYKMYTLRQEAGNDDHYADFRTTLDFLLPDPAERNQFHTRLNSYRESLFRIADDNAAGLVTIKAELEHLLRRVMVRTERLALRADRNGMLKEVIPEAVRLTADDLHQYVGLQRIAREVDHADVLEYWKSAPYLLNFMEDYALRRQLNRAIERRPSRELVRAMQSIEGRMLDRAACERYAKLDPANARLRALYQDTIDREAWRLLWIPPSLPYYRGSGAYADPLLARFTKRLVFSCWRVVPKAIASVLSYEAERRMMQLFRTDAENTKEARENYPRLLQFSYSGKRLTGMPVLGMLYPCRTLARECDPLQHAATIANGGLPSAAEVLQQFELRIDQLLEPVTSRMDRENEATDERWYWAAPLLLDLEYDRDRTLAWFDRTTLAYEWADKDADRDQQISSHWREHVQLAREMVNGQAEPLGRPPRDLAGLLAKLALAGPGVVTLRALQRIAPPEYDIAGICDAAARLGHAFVSLFNRPDVMHLIRHAGDNVPYWQAVLNYGVAGNLQSVLDEYMHLLVESRGWTDQSGAEQAEEIRKEIASCLTLRTSVAKADLFRTGERKIFQDEQLRMRTRFAMRFGDQEAEDSSQTTRADHVRSAFNSPFWPFVLATTSVGQEGLDFHPWCHAVVHWNLPSNPVDLEQREGRVHRYKGHALRKNIASSFAAASNHGATDPWAAMFAAARASRTDDHSDLFPFWIAPEGEAKIERHIPALPHSREIVQQAALLRSLVLYRMVFGQNRQEDLIEYLQSKLSPEQVEQIVEQARIDLSPPALSTFGEQSP